MTLIDTHAHIYLDDFDQDRDEMLEKCKQQQISRIYMPNIDTSSIESMLKLEEKYPDQCIPMMGLHPGSVGKNYEQDLEEIEKILKHRSFAAIGEIGLDFYWDTTYKEQQLEVLNVQINWAKELGLPVVLHFRNAFKETLQVIKDQYNEDLTGIFHCFTGTLDEARQVTELGFYLGIGGVVTFKNGGLDQLIPHLDLENIVLETDSPYLAPVPFRGKRNQPLYIRQVAEKIAMLKSLGIQEVAAITTKNVEKIFRQINESQ
ncbi:MAG: TatD family hydrolase [Candidatus Cyclobacteriaceae bacterium M3_2C_046]